MIFLEDSQLELLLNPNLEIIQNLVKLDESNENSYKLFRDFICSKDNFINETRLKAESFHYNFIRHKQIVQIVFTTQPFVLLRVSLLSQV